MTPKKNESKVFVIALENFSLYYLADSQVIVSRLEARPQADAVVPKLVEHDSLVQAKRLKK
jgi:hypothetical protein